MKKIILLIAVFAFFCMNAMHAQTPVKGLTMTGAYDTIRTGETTSRFVSPTGKLYKRPAMTISGEMLPLPEMAALTFEARKAGATVTFTPAASLLSLSIEYSLNGSAWAPYTTPITLTNVGDTVSFRGTNNTYATSFSAYSNFSCSDSCYIYGNIMSLINKDNFATNNTLTTNYTFCKLFYENDKIDIHATKELILPATTLVSYCYNSMFQGCSGLTTAPALPATTLANSCYGYMFRDCSSLTTVPALPATTLANSCYSGMFQGCSSLTTAPELPATTLANSCYSVMFFGCTSLTTAPELPATTLQESCYSQMFGNCSNLTIAPVMHAMTLARYCCNSMFASCFKLTTAPELHATTLADHCYAAMFMYCTSLTTAPELPAMTLVDGCYQHMFHGCNKLTTSPVLPATTLVDNCYKQMFAQCSKLNKVTCLATNILATDCTTDWLDEGAATGVFVKAPLMNDWILNSTSGIPTGWAVIGAIDGKFTVNASGSQVYFSNGNLQATYNGSSWSWAFAAHQWDYIGSAAGNTSINGNGTVSANNVTVDLFGWVGASNTTWTGAAQYGISKSVVLNSTDGYGNGAYETLKSDWGNTIGTGWRTLSSAEWTYLFNTRSTTSGVRYAKAKVNDVNGIILLPDDWSTSYYSLSSTNTTDADYTSNSISSDVWTSNLAAHGCVFMPAAGYRQYRSNEGQMKVFEVGSKGYYSSTSTTGVEYSSGPYFGSNFLYPSSGGRYRYNGSSVRLVYDVE